MPKKPLHQDPGATAAFQRLKSVLPVIAPSQHASAVVIGGGTGAPVSIRTLLSMGVETSAVVAMADDGGSTGILREEANVTPPGDIRKCLAAFAADPNDPLTRAFKYRFDFAQGHTLGNLMLSALEDATGSFPSAISICEDVLHARGHVYPSTLDKVTLRAKTRDGEILDGQANACHATTALKKVALDSPGEIHPYSAALEVIRDADLIVLGPGSLFTSIIPNLLVPGVVEAIRESPGRTLFVCSLADMQGETWGLTALEHVQALADHGLAGSIDYVLIHSPEPLVAPTPAQASLNAATGDLGHPAKGVSVATMQGTIRPVNVDYEMARKIQNMGAMVICRNLVDPQRPTWHDPQALRDAFTGVLKICRSQRM